MKIFMILIEVMFAVAACSIAFIAIGIIRKQSTKGTKILWMIVVVFLPIIGPAIYLTSISRKK